MSWRRTSKSNPCKICGKPDWCSYTDDGAVRCMRVEDAPYGWKVCKRHVEGVTYRPEGEEQYKSNFIAKKKPAAKQHINFSPMAMKFWDDLDEEKAEGFAKSLGLSGAFVLRVIGLGWSEVHKAYSFPMYSSPDRCIGIRLRTEAGEKFAVKGSSNGLFLVDSTPLGDRVFVCEGPTDTAAMIQLGYESIGRPSCSGGIDFLKNIMVNRDVVIVSDHDSPGRAGAEKLSSELRSISHSIKIIEPPRKDMRDWLNNGASKEAVELLCKNAKELGNAKEVQ